MLAAAKARWDGGSPLFIALGLLAWSMTPTDALILSRSLGPEFEVVLADEYLALLRQALGIDEGETDGSDACMSGAPIHGARQDRQQEGI